MQPAALETLRQLGHQLDNNIYPAVYNGGFVMPCETGVSKTKGEVMHYERQRTRRSKTRPRQGTTGRQRSTSETSSLISTELQTQYESELNAVYKAYPKTLVWKQSDGMILLTESALLYGQDRAARFLVAIPYGGLPIVKGWGFWGISVIGLEWIGPRHTNFPDGSICAFEDRDGTWKIGDPIVQLLDLYTLWALRHLHLKTLDRWPGRQSAYYAYERILELRPDEYCGCEHSEKLYRDCCQPKDRKCNMVTAASNFLRKHHNGYRCAPAKVTNFILNQSSPPSISDLFQIPFSYDPNTGISEIQ